MPETIFGDNGIGVQEQDILTGSFFQALVAAFGKTGIFFIGNKPDYRKPGQEVFDTVIRRVVIYHDYFALDTGNSPLYRAKTLLEEVFDIIIYYDDR